MCTTDPHDVAVGGAVVVGAVVVGAVVVGAVDVAPPVELAPSIDVIGADADDVLGSSTHAPTAASATATAAGRTDLRGTLIASTSDRGA